MSIVWAPVVGVVRVIGRVVRMAVYSANLHRVRTCRRSGCGNTWAKVSIVYAELFGGIGQGVLGAVMSETQATLFNKRVGNLLIADRSVLLAIVVEVRFPSLPRPDPFPITGTQTNSLCCSCLLIGALYEGVHVGNRVRCADAVVTCHAWNMIRD